MAVASVIVLSVVVRWPLLSPLVLLVSHSEKPSRRARVWFVGACREAPACSRASLCVCLHLLPPPFPSCSALCPGLHFHPLCLVIPDQGTPSGSPASRAPQQTSGTGLIPHIRLHLSLMLLRDCKQYQVAQVYSPTCVCLAVAKAQMVCNEQYLGRSEMRLRSPILGWLAKLS